MQVMVQDSRHVPQERQTVRKHNIKKYLIVKKQSEMHVINVQCPMSVRKNNKNHVPHNIL